MRAVPLLLALALTACDGEREEAAPATEPGPEPAPAPEEELDPLAPAPWREEAGLRNVRTTSTVRFTSDPAASSTFQVTLGFPDRGRAMLMSSTDLEDQRRLHLRYGGHAWWLPAGQGVSMELAGPERDRVHLLFELRRALYLWPAGPTWSLETTGGTADLDGRGVLTVELGADGRPTAMRSTDPEGLAYESLEGITWSQDGGRWRPASFDLKARGRPVWHETVERFETDVALIDGFFLPPDRRVTVTGAREVTVLQLHFLDGYVQRSPLPPGTSWESALLRGRVKATQLEQQGGQPLAPGLEVEVDALGAPTAVVFVRDPDAPAPQGGGWTQRMGGEARGLSFERIDQLTLGHLQDLTREVGLAGHRAGVPRVRFEGRELGPVQLVVPFQPQDE